MRKTNEAGFAIIESIILIATAMVLVMFLFPSLAPNSSNDQKPSEASETVQVKQEEPIPVPQETLGQQVELGSELKVIAIWYLVASVVLIIIGGIRYVFASHEKDGFQRVKGSFIMGATMTGLAVILTLAAQLLHAGSAEGVMVSRELISVIRFVWPMALLAMAIYAHVGWKGKIGEAFKVEFQSEGANLEQLVEKQIPAEQKLAPRSDRAWELYDKVIKTLNVLKAQSYRFDVETRHLLEESLHKDATSLYSTYMGIDDDERVSYQKYAVGGLESILRELDRITQSTTVQSVAEMRKALLVIESKYGHRDED